MLGLIVTILVVVFGGPLFVEGSTELLCKSLFFDSFRKKISGWHPFLANLIGCGYCTSVWVATFPAATLTWYLAPSLLIVLPTFVFFVVVYHRSANYLHNFNDKFLDKYYDSRFN